MELALGGLRALVTGSSSGIGAGIAARAGSGKVPVVVVHGRDSGPCSSSVGETTPRMRGGAATHWRDRRPRYGRAGCAPTWLTSVERARSAVSTSSSTTPVARLVPGQSWSGSKWARAFYGSGRYEQNVRSRRAPGTCLRARA